MQRKLRKVIVVSLVFVMLFAMSICVEAASSLTVVSPTSQFYVNDFADIFTDEEEVALVKDAKDYADETGGIQIVITTVPSLEEAVTSDNYDHYVEDVANAMYNQYGIGKNSMGMLILFSERDRKIRIENGDQMETYVTDRESGKLLDDSNVIDHLKNDQFTEGLINLQGNVITLVSSKVPSNWNSSSDETVGDNQVESEEKNTIKPMSLWSIISGVLLLLIAIALAFFSHKKEKKIQNLSEELDECKRNREEKENHYNETLSVLNANHAQELREKKEEYQKLSQKYNSVYSSLEKLTEKFRRATLLHPNLEQEIVNMIEDEYRVRAEEISSEAKKVYGEKTEREKLSKYQEMIEKLEGEQDDVKKYYTFDVKALKDRYKEACHLQDEYDANLAYDKISKGFDEKTGTHKNYKKLSELWNTYSTLTAGAQKIFHDPDLITRLKKEYFTSKADYEAYEAAKSFLGKLAEVLSEVGYRGHSKDKYDLSKMQDKYANLSSAAQKYVPLDKIDELNKRYREAKSDYYDNRYSISSSSHHYGSSNYGGGFGGGGFSSGFGGHSSGGGASRGF